MPGYAAWDAARLADPRLVLGRHVARGLGRPGARLGATAYRGVAEETLYVAESARGIGAGAGLLRALIEQAEGAGIWTLQAASSPRTARASPCTSAAASASSARANGWESSATPGETSF